MKLLISVVRSDFDQYRPDEPVVKPHNSHKAKIVVLSPSNETASLLRKLGDQFEMSTGPLWSVVFEQNVESLVETLQIRPEFEVKDLRNVTQNRQEREQLPGNRFIKPLTWA